MSAYLISGVSGAGKTTITAALIDYGFDAIDMSNKQGLSSWIDSEGNSCTRPNPTAASWFNTHHYEWNLQALAAVITGQVTSRPLFLCGNAFNMADGFHLFDKIFYLKVGESIILKRLQRDDRLSDFGRSDVERDQISIWIQRLEAKMANTPAITIDGDQPVSHVVNTIFGSVGLSPHDDR